MIPTKTATGPTGASRDVVVEWVLVGLPTCGSQLAAPLYLYLADIGD